MKEWKKVKLGSLLTESRIVSESPDVNKRITVKLNVNGIEKRPVTSNKIGSTKYYLRSTGQFIYGKQNLHKGAFGIVPKELNGFESSSDLPAFDVENSCYPEWIYYFFKKGNFYLTLESIAKGVGSKRIQPNQIFDLDIFLPEKEEQKRILLKIKQLEQKYSELLIELEKQKSNVLNLRKAILSDAVQGNLTKEWRKDNPSIEISEDLLQNLNLVDKLDFPFQIPANWVFCRLGDHVKCERGRFSARPRNDPQFYGGNFPFIQIGDLSDKGGLIKNHRQTLNEKGLAVSKLFPKGTIVIAIVGATIGNSGILGYDMCFPDSLIGVRPQSYFNSEYVEFFLRQRKEKFRQESYSGGGQPNIKLSTLNAALFPLPPFEEQKVIVERVITSLFHCDRLDDEINENIKIANDSYQSILTEFLGMEDNITISNELKSSEKEEIFKRKIKYSSKTTLMELVELLKKHGKLHAEDLWRMSKFPNDIDAFYAELKQQVEIKKKIKEVKNEKGYLELA